MGRPRARSAVSLENARFRAADKPIRQVIPHAAGPHPATSCMASRYMERVAATSITRQGNAHAGVSDKSVSTDELGPYFRGIGVIKQHHLPQPPPGRASAEGQCHGTGRRRAITGGPKTKPPDRSGMSARTGPAPGHRRHTIGDTGHHPSTVANHFSKLFHPELATFWKASTRVSAPPSDACIRSGFCRIPALEP